MNLNIGYVINKKKYLELNPSCTNWQCPKLDARFECYHQNGTECVGLKAGTSLDTFFLAYDSVICLLCYYRVLLNVCVPLTDCSRATVCRPLIYN